MTLRWGWYLPPRGHQWCARSTRRLVERSQKSSASLPVTTPSFGHVRSSSCSRSEPSSCRAARRLLDGLEADFDTVEVDFTGVTDVGQGFVDELLRVWPAAHPGKTVIPTNTNEAVEFMIQRGLSRIERPNQ